MSDILLPGSESAVIDIVRAHHASGEPLAITGGNTRSGLGYPVAGTALSTRALSGITAYNPAELTLTAKAGTPLSEIEAALAEKGQMLAFEPMDHRPLLGTSGEPTLGGVFAANVSGPRRFVSGAARDHLLGLRFVNGEGDAVKSGGRVMKNVTGLDLVKLLCGSYGTLGIITELTVKLTARPKQATTIVISGLNDAEAAQAMAAAMRLSTEVSGAAHLPMSVSYRFLNGQLPDGPATVLRLEGLEASVEVRSQKLTDEMQKFGPVSRLDAAHTASLWQEIRDVAPFAAARQKPLWQVSVAPMTGHLLLASLRLETGVDAFYDWQGGLLWLQMEAGSDAALIRRYIKSLGGGHATLVRASDAERAVVSAFEPQPPAVQALSERLRLKFDPKSILNPGRMNVLSSSQAGG